MPLIKRPYKKHNKTNKKVRGNKVRGGNPFRPVPAPFVGKPWGPPITDWPGVDGVDGGRNYLAQNMYLNDPQTMMKLEGGGKQRVKTRRAKRGRKTFKKTYHYGKKNIKRNTRINTYKKHKRGGGLVPQDLVNLGRDFAFHAKSAYNTINGYPLPVNPAPFKDQL